MVLIDPRSNPPRDRTWCHWQLRDHPFSAAVSHRWQDWVVCDGNRVAATHHSPHPYACIPSDRFFQIALKKLSASPLVDFLHDCSVAAIHDHAALRLSDGLTVHAGWAFDSRPPLDSGAPWRQIFRGLELHSSAANLDPTAVTLMDFVSADQNGIRFFYVLPLDAHTALVDDTWLVQAGRTPRPDDAFILEYARKSSPRSTGKSAIANKGICPWA